MILVPEAINLERVISYAMQNRAPIYKYLVILVHHTKLQEKPGGKSEVPQAVGREWVGRAGSGHAKNPLTCQCLSAHILRWRGLEYSDMYAKSNTTKPL